MYPTVFGDDNMIIKEEIMIHELPTQDMRRLYIYLPPEYEYSDEYYPVLYMFDGHNVFYDRDATYGKSWGMEKYLQRANPALIIVAVECNHEGNRRLSEYSPWDFDFKSSGFIEGCGRIYMDWLINELKPWIDHEFRTKAGRESTFICGSSMGGLMSVYAVTAYNHVFSKAAALSPSLWVAPNDVNQMIRDTNFMLPTQVYMSYGSEEMGNHKRIRNALKKASGSLMDRGVYVCMHIVPGGQHCEACWEQQVPMFMECLDIKNRPVRRRKRNMR